MKQTSTRLLSYQRLAPGFWGLLALLSGSCSAAFAAGRVHGASRAPLALASPTAVVYTWSATGSSASWSAPGSWTPARNIPDPSDILQFTTNGAAPTVLIDFGASQTIAGLFISTSSALTFSTDGTDGTNTGFGRTLTITNGSTNADLTLSSGSTLTIYTSSTYSANTGLAMTLGSGATATIGGHLTFDSAVTSTNSTSQILQGSGTNAIEFTNGSVFTAGSNFKGYPFGTAAASANSVAFRNGSRYEQGGGSTPFGSSSTITYFEPTSYYYFTAGGAVALSGRTYGNFEYNPGTTSTSSAGSSPVTFQGNLIVTGGTANITFSGGINLQGSLLVNGGTLNLSPATANSYTVQLNGTAAQNIGGTGGTLTLGANTTLQVNNAAGVTLTRPLTVAGTLQLTNGLLTTTATNLLTLAAGATTSGSATSFVNGPLRRAVGAVSTATAVGFPIGKGADYRPLTLNIASQTSNTIYQAEQFNQDGGTILAAPLQRVSRFRFYTITPYDAAAPATVAQPTGFSGTLTVSFGTSDRVTSPAATSFVVAKRADSSQPWATTGASTGSTTTGTVGGPLGTFASGTLTSGSFSSFSDFVLASTEADPTVNPLPVQLTSFTAVRAARGGVALAWATASELRSARFEVERSTDGRTFAIVATVAAAGSSAQARAYATQDAGAPLGQLYYRLRLVDADGPSTYSPVATAAGAAGELVLTPNPAHDQLALLVEAATAYTVRNTLGQPVLAGTTQAGTTTMLDVNGLAAGVYFFELHGGTGRVVRRFVKE